MRLPAASNVLSGGGARYGSVVSVIVMVCAAAAAFPLGSVAVQLTRVGPTGNAAGASLAMEGAAHELSDAAGAARLTGGRGAVASAVMFAGTAIDGGVVSDTVTL